MHRFPALVILQNNWRFVEAHIANPYTWDFELIWGELHTYGSVTNSWVVKMLQDCVWEPVTEHLGKVIGNECEMFSSEEAGKSLKKYSWTCSVTWKCLLQGSYSLWTSSVLVKLLVLITCIDENQNRFLSCPNSRWTFAAFFMQIAILYPPAGRMSIMR